MTKPPPVRKNTHFCEVLIQEISPRIYWIVHSTHRILYAIFLTDNQYKLVMNTLLEIRSSPDTN